jgi:hypothetical protein
MRWGEISGFIHVKKVGLIKTGATRGLGPNQAVKRFSWLVADQEAGRLSLQ